MGTAPVSAADATPDWEGWREIWETRYEMAKAAEGVDAFLKYLETKIRGPRRFRQNQARGIAALLRGAPGGADYPRAVPLAEVLLILRSVHVRGSEYSKPNEHTVGRWAREGGGRVFYSTLALHGAYLPPATKNNASLNVISSSLATVRLGVERLEKVDAAECAVDLDQEMRRQMLLMADDMRARLELVHKLVRAGE